MLRSALAIAIASTAILPTAASARIFSFDLEALALQKAMAPATTEIGREQKAAAIRYVTGLMQDARQSMDTIGRQSSR